MTPAAFAAARAALHEAAEGVRLRLVRSGRTLAQALDCWDEDTARRRALLLIEDQPELAAITEAALEQALGMEVYVASTFAEGHRLARALPWACVVLDLHLADPEGTGVEILDAIPRKTPVVICTGRLDPDELQRLAQRSRASCHLKGDNTRDLADVVREAIAAHGGTP